MTQETSSTFLLPGSEAAARLPIAALAPDPRNPRKISEEAKAGLAISLEVFGPLDIVFNQITGELVSGHQRVAQLKAAGAAEVKREGEFWFIEHPKTGERFVVRFVEWDETKQRMGNLVANNPHLQGEFTEDAIEQVRSLEREMYFNELQLTRLLKQEVASNFEENGEDGSGKLRENFQIIVTCADETHQFMLLTRFTEEGLKCRALTKV